MFRSLSDSTLKLGLKIVASCSVLVVVLIAGFLCYESYPAVSQLGFRLFSDPSWHPSEFDDGKFGLLPILVGTLLVSFGAISIAAPMGIAAAIYSQFYASPKLAFVFRRLIELLAGIPSVVFGFWGLVVLCPAIANLVKTFTDQSIPGPSLLAAILVVALMILPTVMLLAEVAISRVRREYILGASACAMGRLAIIRHVVLPQAKMGIVTGIVLALARAIGETMAVVMVAGNIVKIPGSIFDPVRTLTANVALEMGYALGLQRSALFFSGLLLLALVAVLFSIEILLRRGVWKTS